MSFSFQDSTARTAWGNATTQTGQLTAFAALWSGDVTVRYYTSGGTHLGTATHSGWDAIDTSTDPYSVTLAGRPAWSHLADGTAAYCIVAVPGGADIIRADVSLAAAVGASTGIVNLDNAAGAAGLRINAASALPFSDLPAWRTAMVAADTLYYVSAASGAGLAGGAPSLTGLPTHFGPSGTGDGGSGDDVMSGYSSGTLLADVGGPHGTYVFGTGGHTRLQNQMLGIDLNADSPVYAWWHDPTYKTSNTGGAQLYYSPSEQATLEAGVRGLDAIIPAASVTGVVGTGTTPTTTAFTPSSISASFTTDADFLKLRTCRFDDATATAALRGVSRVCSASSAASLPLITLASALPAPPASGDTFTFPTEDAGRWDRAFPVAFDGWIYPAKLTTGQMGDNVPHGFRFFSIAHVPASVTGGDSVMFAHIAAQGPFSQTWYPDTGSTMDEWADAGSLFTVGADLRRRMPYYTRNLTTGAWSLHQWRPDIAPYTYGGLISHTFPDLKRVYSLGVAVNAAGTTALGYWYVDMASGIGSATESAWIIPTGDNEGTSFALGEYTCGAWTVGHPDDLHIFIGPDANFSDGLIVIDLDTDTIARIDLSAFSFTLPANGDFIGMSYDATGNRVLILLKNTGTHALTYWSIGLPANPMVVTGYTAELRSVTTSEGSMPLSDIAYMYGKTRIHPTLGCILIPTNSGRMMGFVPSAA